jgi:hypothetical protein
MKPKQHCLAYTSINLARALINQIIIMKKKITILGYMLLAMTAFTMSCKKQELPQQAPPVQTSKIRFSFAALPGTPNGTIDLSAIVTIADINNQSMVTNKILPLSYENGYRTETIELPKGNYKLTKLIIINTAGIAHYAAPMVNSAKAVLVQKPLAMSIAVTDPITIPVEVLRIEATDSPESFGYPAGAFTGPSDARNFKISLRAAIKVGGILYDSIPSAFSIKLWDENGILHQKDTILPAGTNQLELPKSYTKYGFQMRKWGLTVDMTLLKNEVDESNIYILGGTMAAKKLKLATEYAFINGAFELKEKKLFDYDNEGRVKEVKYYTRSPYQAELKHTSTDLYYYIDNGVKVYHVDLNNGNTEPYNFLTFSVNSEGKRNRAEFNWITEHLTYENVYNNGGITMYFIAPDGTRTGSKTELNFKGGNCIEQKWVSPASVYSYRYGYDLNINPYVHMKWPDLYFENESKNNMLQKTTVDANGIEKLAGTFINSYDSDGFLTEVNRGTSKTIFTY